MPFDIDRYSHCLFAFLYQQYKDSKSTVLAGGLPADVKYIIPIDFDRTIMKCQLIINDYLRPYFQEVFAKACVWAGRTERTFMGFCKRRCLSLPVDYTPLLFMTICAVVSELNLYLFQRECFRYARYAPICLAEVSRSSDDVSVSLIETEEYAASFGETPVDAMKVLREYCTEILKCIEKDPNYIPPILESVGNRFSRDKDKPIDWKVEFNTLSEPSVVEEDEDKPDKEESSRMVAETARMLEKPPSSPNQCKFCKEEECTKYLNQFVTDFIAKYN